MFPYIFPHHFMKLHMYSHKEIKSVFLATHACMYNLKIIKKIKYAANSKLGPHHISRLFHILPRSPYVSGLAYTFVFQYISFFNTFSKNLFLLDLENLEILGGIVFQVNLWIFIRQNCRLI